MMKFWNPIEAYRKASQRAKNEQTRHEAKSKICIGDYTDSNGNTYTESPSTASRQTTSPRARCN